MNDPFGIPDWRSSWPREISRIAFPWAAVECLYRSVIHCFASIDQLNAMKCSQDMAAEPPLFAGRWRLGSFAGGIALLVSQLLHGRDDRFGLRPSGFGQSFLTAQVLLFRDQRIDQFPVDLPFALFCRAL